MPVKVIKAALGLRGSHLLFFDEREGIYQALMISSCPPVLGGATPVVSNQGFPSLAVFGGGYLVFSQFQW